MKSLILIFLSSITLVIAVPIIPFPGAQPIQPTQQIQPTQEIPNEMNYHILPAPNNGEVQTDIPISYHDIPKTKQAPLLEKGYGTKYHTTTRRRNDGEVSKMVPAEMRYHVPVVWN
ncbi:hypothetical protein BZA77DRAFT_305850 [Pyronema omphalodes]|nr:hypothetical protein BZA77DRAFT_305850 [Pyronema omphalodes]